ncbi:hypothetical protein M3226_09765 [Neobacillus cucumis]|nr:hypothetical protein [Neobacillus cucumis]MCM3725968.1 hypothetical protein [Neobacillus cucumis]
MKKEKGLALQALFLYITLKLMVNVNGIILLNFNQNIKVWLKKSSHRVK